MIGERLNHIPALPSSLAFLYLAIFSSLVGFSAYSFLLRHTRPAVFTSHAYTNPVVAVALGVMFENERFNRLQFLAMAITLAALLFITVHHQETPDLSSAPVSKGQ